MPTNLDMDVLRSFVTGVDLGGFAKAAARVGRSPSAISLQLRKLEDQVGRPLLVKDGRGLALTEAGDAMLGFARRLLDLNDAALAAVQIPGLAGEVRLGLPQDVAETRFPEVLARFARLHPDVRIAAHVERSAIIRAAFDAGGLDLALVWREGAATAGELIVTEMPMTWIGPRAGAMIDPANPLPLVVFDAPCLFRRAALDALDAARKPWRIGFTSPSLSGLWAAVAAGLGVTVRTAHGLPASLAPLDPAASGLPPLPRLGLSLLGTSPCRSPAAERLAATIRETFADVSSG